MAVKLELGYYGGCCQHLGAYSYRGFDIVISDDYGDTPVEGLTFTLGLYEEGCDETEWLFDIENFSMSKAVYEVDSHIDFLLASGYKEPDVGIREMRKLLKHTFDIGDRALIETAIKERQVELSRLNVESLPVALQSLVVEKECTCGAKHTSNPRFHMSWCDKK